MLASTEKTSSDPLHASEHQSPLREPSSKPASIDKPLDLAELPEPDSKVAQAVKAPAAAKPSIGKALLLQLLLGAGLFYADGQLKRKWIYPFALVAMLFGFMLAIVDFDYINMGGDIVPDEFAGLVGFVGILVYLVGIVDVLRVCRSQQSR